MVKIALLGLMAVVAAVSGFLSEATAGDAKIRIIRGGSQPSVSGPADRYTGTVHINHPFQADDPGRHRGEYVFYEPGSRSAWHTNPAGERVYIVSGRALVQELDGPIQEVTPGEVIWFPPNVKHWLGAASDSQVMTLSFFEHVNGETAAWLAKVTDEQYVANTGGKTPKYIEISTPSQEASGKAPATRFTGTVRTDQIFAAKPGIRSYGGIVTFEPGARTFWHTHPNGQTLIVTMGRGYVGQWGEKAIAVKEGDIVWFPPEVKHYHSAAPDTGFVTISMSEREEGGVSTNWLEQVTDEQFFAATGAELNPEVMPLRLQKIAIISALTANGDTEKLKIALAEGLQSGLTVNEIKEVLIHNSAYTGFPRALNAINTFIAVMDEREKQGIKDEYGPEATPVDWQGKNKYEYGHKVLAALRNSPKTPTPPRYESFTPTIEIFLKEQLFADIFARDTLNHLEREIATVGALSNLPGANAQFRSHTGLAMTQGATKEQLRHLFTVMGDYFGKEREANAKAVLQEAVNNMR